MFGLKTLFKRKQQRDDFKVMQQRISRNQEAVFQAVAELAIPASGRMVANHLGWDSASVTNRLSELTRKKRIHVAYRKKGLDGLWRKYYLVRPR